MDEYERIIIVKPEVFVYKIPPRTTNRGYRASDWKLDQPDWTGRLRIVAKGKECFIKLEDKISGELFGLCPVDKYPGIAVESVMDSSRYFVIRIQDGGERSAFIGIGFADRGDSFDLNVALQDHFKWLQKSEEIDSEEKNQPQLDLSLKEGQTITINMNIGKKSSANKQKAKPFPGGGLGLLPPPPGSKNQASTSQPPASFSSSSNTANSSASDSANAASLLLDFASLGGSAPTTNTATDGIGATDTWGEFTSGAGTSPPTNTDSQFSNPSSNNTTNSSNNWVNF